MAIATTGDGRLQGTLLWVTGAGEQSPPRVAYNPQQNEYLVIWGEEDAEDHELRGRRVSSAGTLVGGELVLADSGPGGYGLAHNEASNEYLLVWGTQGDDIQGQRLDRTGNRLGSPFAISATESGEMVPAVCYNSRAGEYTVVWQEFHEATDWDVYGRQVSAAGSPLGDRFAVATAPEFQTDVALAANSTNGEMLIAWQDFRHDNWDIYGQRWMPPSVSTTPTATPSVTPTRTATPTPTGAGPTSVFIPLLLKGG